MSLSNWASVFVSACLTLGVTGTALAQATPAPVVPPAAAQAPGAGGIQSQNIFEVKPDASNDPGYAAQTNSERSKVQPGNNAPVWRQVGAGSEGHSSLPKSEAPEAGILIQPFTQYPGSKLTNAGEAWRQVRNNWIIPYGGTLVLIVIGAIALFYWRKGAEVWGWGTAYGSKQAGQPPAGAVAPAGAQPAAVKS